MNIIAQKLANEGADDAQIFEVLQSLEAPSRLDRRYLPEDVNEEMTLVLRNNLLNAGDADSALHNIDMQSILNLNDEQAKSLTEAELEAIADVMSLYGLEM